VQEVAHDPVASRPIVGPQGQVVDANLARASSRLSAYRAVTHHGLGMACEFWRFRTARHRDQRVGHSTKGLGPPTKSGTGCTTTRCSEATSTEYLTAAPGRMRPTICSSGSPNFSRCHDGSWSTRVGAARLSPYEHLTANGKIATGCAVVPFVGLVGWRPPRSRRPDGFALSWGPWCGEAAASIAGQVDNGSQFLVAGVQVLAGYREASSSGVRRHRAGPRESLHRRNNSWSGRLSRVAVFCDGIPVEGRWRKLRPSDVAARGVARVVRDRGRGNAVPPGDAAVLSELTTALDESPLRQVGLDDAVLWLGPRRPLAPLESPKRGWNSLG
jgi:hypothetical protein